MRMKYGLYPITGRERILITHCLLHEMERQQWFAIVSMKLWNSEGLICTQ